MFKLTLYSNWEGKEKSIKQSHVSVAIDAHKHGYSINASIQDGATTKEPVIFTLTINIPNMQIKRELM